MDTLHLFPASSLHFLLWDLYSTTGFDVLKDNKGEHGARTQPG